MTIWRGVSSMMRPRTTSPLLRRTASSWSRPSIAATSAEQTRSMGHVLPPGGVSGRADFSTRKMRVIRIFGILGAVQDVEVRQIELDGRSVSYTLRRSARARYLRADIGLRTGLRVTLPDGLNEARIEAFLRSRRVWVLRALGRLERLAALIPDRSLGHDTTVPYLGATPTLNLSNASTTRVGRLGDSLM